MCFPCASGYFYCDSVVHTIRSPFDVSAFLDAGIIYCVLSRALFEIFDIRGISVRSYGGDVAWRVWVVLI